MGNRGGQLIVAVLAAGSLLAGVDGDATEIAGLRARVEHHLREAQQIAQHFETLVSQDCPRFATPREWSAYLDAELDRAALLVAHMEEAWSEARRADDDELRRSAKVPRRWRGDAHVLVEKLQVCAADNGAAFVPLAALRRIEREVPRRREAIALPN